MFRVNRIDNAADLATLEKPWRELVGELGIAGNIFFSFEWVSAWWEAYGTSKKLHLLAMWDGDRLAGIAPLMLTAATRGWRTIRTIEFIGRPDAGDLDFIGLDKSTLVREVLRYLSDHAGDWDRVDLFQVDADSPLAAAALQVLRENHSTFRLKVRASESDVDSGAGIEESGSPAIRELNGHAILNVTEISDPQEINAHLPILFQIDINCRNADIVPSRFHDSHVRRFYFELVKKLSPLGRVNLIRLSSSGDVPVAYGIYLSSDRAVRPQAIAINPLFGRTRARDLFRQRQNELFAGRGLEVENGVRYSEGRPVRRSLYDIRIYRKWLDYAVDGRVEEFLESAASGLASRRGFERKIARAVMILHQKGLGFLAGKLLKGILERIGHFLVTYREFYILRHDGPPTTKTRTKLTLEIRKMSIDDVDRLATFYGVTTRRAKYDTFVKRFGLGADCFAALHHGYIVSVIWGLYHGDFHQELNLSLIPKSDEVVLCDALTSPIYRSMGAAAYLMMAILNEYKKAGINPIAGVLKTNKPSRKGLELFQFKHIATQRILKILGIRII